MAHIVEEVSPWILVHLFLGCMVFLARGARRNGKRVSYFDRPRYERGQYEYEMLLIVVTWEFYVVSDIIRKLRKQQVHA
jgi:hypothetical protein